LWREISFAIHLIRQAVNPPLDVSECIAQWREIANNLAESPRKRNYQMQYLAEVV
jgi:hypothetical protein